MAKYLLARQARTTSTQRKVHEVKWQRTDLSIFQFRTRIELDSLQNKEISGLSNLAKVKAKFEQNPRRTRSTVRIM